MKDKADNFLSSLEQKKLEYQAAHDDSKKQVDGDRTLSMAEKIKLRRHIAEELAKKQEHVRKTKNKFETNSAHIASKCNSFPSVKESLGNSVSETVSEESAETGSIQ